MSTNNQPITAASTGAAAPSVPASTQNKLELLLELMLKKEEASLVREKAERDRSTQIATQREKTQSHEAYKVIMLQASCKHLKGGRRLKADSKIDYNVTLHVFPDGVWQIKCLTCCARWRKQDTAEFFIRGSKKIPNHTKMGWQEAMRLVDQSTNTFSSSEVNMDVHAGKKHPADGFVIPEGFEY